MEALRRLVIAAAGLTLAACGADNQCSLGGAAHTFASTGSCGASGNVEVYVGCFTATGAGSQPAGYPQATNLASVTEGNVVLADGGQPPLHDGGMVFGPDGGILTQVRRCSMRASGDAGYAISCDIYPCSPDGGAECAKVAGCEAQLTPVP